jgi:hypothetical protein
VATLERVVRNGTWGVTTMVGLMSPGNTMNNLEHTHVDNMQKRPSAPHFSAYALMGHEQSSARALRRVRKYLTRSSMVKVSKKLPLLPGQDPIPQHSRTGVAGRPAALNLPGDSRPQPRLASDTEVAGTSGIAQEGPPPAAGVFLWEGQKTLLVICVHS